MLSVTVLNYQPRQVNTKAPVKAWAGRDGLKGILTVTDVLEAFLSLCENLEEPRFTGL